MAWTLDLGTGKLNLSELVHTPVPVDIEFGPKV